PLAELDVLHFDAGPAGSELESHAIELNLDSVYTREVGFGWLQRPQKAFHRGELTRSRTALTVDGVSGKRVGFRADVATGRWFLTLWLETGQTLGSWPEVIIQDQRQTVSWQEFRPPAEPSRSLQKTYRLFHCITTASSDGLSVQLIGTEDNVRLLGISLIRQVPATKPEHRTFLQQVELASGYRERTSPTDLLRQTGTSLHKNSTDALFAIWRHRLELLAAAERHYSMRGWRWADEETGIGMTDRQRQAIMLLDSLLLPDAAASKLFAERVLNLRGRLLYWLGKEGSGLDEIAAGNGDLELLAERYPDDEILAMYTGKRIALADPCDCLKSTADAPDWSVAQREALCRLRLLVHWWVEQRQSDTGELGGKLGDDVEMLRWWAPLCLSGDETALRGWKKLADGVWKSDHLHDGYARKVRDVEHAAEFVADTAPLMIVYSDDPQYAKRLTGSACHFESLWTGMTVNGNRFFRSAWFSSTAVETDEPKGRDLEYNTRAVQAMRYQAWRTPNPRLEALLHQWSLAWVNVAMRTDKAKPKGIIPASVRFSDEAFNGDGPNWYQANMYWDYYDWEHYAGSLLLDQLLFTYALTKDEQLLQPMLLALELIRSHESVLSEANLDSQQKGSPAWAAASLVRCSLFWNVVEQWRFLANDPRWDDLIMRYGTPYGRYRISGEEQHLVDGLNLLLEDVRYNTPLKTTEVLYTDRVRVPGAEVVKAMLTGDGIYANFSPYYATSWQQTDDNFTALVAEANPDQLAVHLFSHGLEDREVIMRVWQLAPGRYRLLCEAVGLAPREEAVAISQPGQRVPVTLPAQRLMRITMQRIR
ncbi:MAG: hypothetical protein WD229_08475, partial [Pirellulales bacterium]